MDNLGENNESKNKTTEGFNQICKDAVKEQHKHEYWTKHCRRLKNYHSLSVFFSGLLVSSVLFTSMVDLAPRTMKWVAAFLALYSASCSGINSYCRYPEREGEHSQASKRFKSFSISCTIQISRYEAKSLDNSQFQALLEQHLEDFRDLIESSPETIR